MHIFKEIAPLQAHLSRLRTPGNSIGFVPTMGALHAGHASLIDASKTENVTTVCSIYVNPTQFNNPEDLKRYPRTWKEDVSLLEKLKCDILFAPETSEMYENSFEVSLGFGTLSETLEGAFRPGHFNGVGLVVAKLFHIVRPDRAYFGQKDFQQFKVVTRMVRSLKFEVKLVCMPIVREEDGLAMSSRNQRLGGEERKRATVLYQSLCRAREGLIAGKPLGAVRSEVEDLCKNQNARLEYFIIADRENLDIMDSVSVPDRCILLIAAHVGKVRLIDNLYLRP